MNIENLNELKKDIKHWYMALILEIIFIAVAIWVLVTPEESFISLVKVFSLTFFFTGVLEIIFTIQFRKLLNGWEWFLTVGILDFLIGILLILKFQISIVVLTLFVGFVFLSHSVMIITWSIELKKYKGSSWIWLLWGGTIGVIFSFLLLWNPTSIRSTIVLCSGFALLMIGISEIYFSFISRKIKTIIKKPELKELFYEE